MDIDNEKKPNIVANIVDYELKSNYDIISLEFKLFGVEKTFSVRRPSFYKIKKISQNHHWEVNSNPETKLEKLTELFHDHGFKIMEQSYYQDRYFIALERIS